MCVTLAATALVSLPATRSARGEPVAGDGPGIHRTAQRTRTNRSGRHPTAAEPRTQATVKEAKRRDESARPQVTYPEQNGYVAFEAEHFSSNEGYAVFSAGQVSQLRVLCDPDSCDATIADKLASSWDSVSGGKLVQSTGKGDRVSFSVVTTTPGEWLIALRGWSSHHMANGIYVQVDGRPTDLETKTGKHKLQKLAEWRWFVIDKDSTGQEGGRKLAPWLANLEPGRHTLTLVSSGEAPLIDKVLLMSRAWFSSHATPAHCPWIPNVCVEKIGAGAAGPPSTPNR